MGTMGLGTLSAYSRKRIPSPPQKITTFICITPYLAVKQGQAATCKRTGNCHHLLFFALISAKCASLMDLYLGYGHNELATPFANESVLLDDLVF